jgi:uncharacterized cupin superfamily protein
MGIRPSRRRAARRVVPNIYGSNLEPGSDYASARLAEQAGAEHLGMTLYELAPGQGMVFHYHLQREELLVVLSGTLTLRTAGGWRDLPEGGIVAFPRGETGAHAYENRGDGVVRVLMISEQNAPNVSVYPDTNEIGVFDVARRADRRFGALFNVADAVSDYGGGRAQIVQPAKKSGGEQQGS